MSSARQTAGLLELPGIPALCSPDVTGDKAERRRVEAVASGDTPDRAYDRPWARALLEPVPGRLRQGYADSGRNDFFSDTACASVARRSESPPGQAAEALPSRAV